MHAHLLHQQSAMKLLFFAELLVVFFKYSCFLAEVQEKEYCIIQNITDYSSPCGYQHAACKNSCALLSDYTSRGEFNNVKFTFYEGTHYLYEVWELTGGSNLILSAKMEGEVRVKCKASESGIQFSNVTGILLQGIEFISCGISNRGFSTKFQNRAALLFISVKDLNLQNIRIQKPSTAGGISLNNVRGNIFINNSQFQNAVIPSKNYTTGNFIGYSKCDHRVTILTIRNTLFENNTYNFDKKCIFEDYHLAAGLSVVLKCLDVQIGLFNVTLRKNRGCAGGNMAILYLNLHTKQNLVNSIVTIAEKSVLEEGYGNVGGGIFVTLTNPEKLNFIAGNTTTIPITKTTEFLVINDTKIINNTGFYIGGGIFLKHLEELKRITDGVVQIIGCHFERNLKKAKNNGGYALHFTTFVARGYKRYNRPQLKVKVSSCNFSHHGQDLTENPTRNSPKYGDAVIFVKESPYFGINKTNIVDNMCSGLTAITSNVIISDTVNISNNTAYSGGGILLCSNALLYFKQHTHLIITGNHAEHTGGGINVETECVLNSPVCFFQVSSYVNHNRCLLNTLNATVFGNTANYSGKNIYGGSIDNCNMINSKKFIPHLNFSKIFNVTRNSHEHNSSIASNPRKICIKPHKRRGQDNLQCNIKHEENIYPGQTFTIDAVIQGQHRGLVPGTVYARLNREGIYLEQANYIQALPTIKHTKLTYRVYSKLQNVQAQLYLTVEEEGANPHAFTTNITLKIKDCPFGFKLDHKSSQSACRCTDLQTNGQVKGRIKCSISEHIWIRYYPRLWIGSVDDRTTSTKVIALCITCPRDYCKNSSIILPLEGGSFNSTLQCAFNRSGVLCGACSEGNSVILGSSKCQKCSNLYLLLLFFFAFAGLALIFFISFLNLTVSVATLNGIIFYANIVQIYSFFIFNEESSFLKIFISWLNLDFGINLCFFDGMDGLSKALLQFAFPTYLWLIAGVIILLSKRYELIMKLFGSNIVQVLATLILLSYTKIIRASTDALHCTRLILPTTNSFHWSMDGNLNYFEGNHKVVFTIGALFGIISLPFSIILLCIGHLPRISNWPLFSWINKLKPFFDCYTGTLSSRGRFWVGLLLIARIILLVVYSFNISGSEIMKMSITVLMTLFLLLFVNLFTKGVYSKHYLNILESFSITNLGSLFIGLLCCYYYNLYLAKIVIVKVSVGICFISFVLVITYHVYQKLRCYRLSRWALFKRHSHRPNACGNKNVMEYPPYFGFNEDREPLLDN